MNLQKNLTIGTWNVRGLKQIGKLLLMGKELERLSVDICGILETKVLILHNSIQSPDDSLSKRRKTTS